MFRQSPRVAGPPSSFPSGLQPVASDNGNGSQQQRLSRTDLSFEQALHSQDTVLIREGIDVNALGAGTETNISSGLPRSLQIGVNPPTPATLPPTPSPSNHGAGPSSSAKTYPTTPNDSFYNAEDRDYQTKRRSMYRSPGSASSPDLATLMRKKKRPEPLVKPDMLTPDPSRTRLRTSSATPSSNSSSSNRGKYMTERFMGSPSSRQPEWNDTNLPEDESPKKTPKSVRAKTSAFLGRMMGTSTVREKPRYVSTNGAIPHTPTMPHHNSLFSAFPPPVPPLPSKQQSHTVNSDVFGDSALSPDLGKPLPAIRDSDPPRDSDDSDENSLVVVEPPKSTHSPLHTPRGLNSDFASQMRSSKRRSMSVSDAETKKQLANPHASGGDQEDSAGWASAFNGIFTEMSDPNSLSSLTLRDPSTPDKRVIMNRSKSDTVTASPLTLQERPAFRSILTAPLSSDAPTFNVEPPSLVQESPLSSATATLFSTPMTSPYPSPDGDPPIIPPRSSSLQSPPGSAGRTSNLRFGPRPPMSAGHHSRESSRRLVVQPLLGASNSEPTLVPHEDDNLDNGRSVRLAPSTGSFVYSDTISSSAPPLTPETSTGDLVSTNFRSSPSPAPEDLESKAKTFAARCWNEDEEFLGKEKIAEWLGGHGRINGMALFHYMENFDFSGLRLDVAFRRLCEKLFLKAETQQVDRILEAFANRFWVCNPSSILRSASVVHAVAYSLLLLNTDLHVAELSSRMSRNQFVRNTLSAIQMQLQSSASNSDFDANSVRQGSDHTSSTSHRGKRSDSITSWNSITREGILIMGNGIPTAPNGSKSGNGSTASFPTSNGDPKSPEPVVAPLYDRNWEIEMESMLKEIYNAIKSQQVLQPLGSSLGARSSTSSLTPHGNLVRHRSGRGPPDRLATLKRGSIRGLQTILGNQIGVSPYSSNSSIDGRLSPSPSFSTSHEMHSSNVSFLAPTLGFASNLSHTIIREAQEDDDHHSVETNSTNISISDEELALLGAPWAKEGMLCRKQFWESTNKKAKSRSWMDVFVVIQKGELNMFIFGDKAGGGSGVVGGGNWLENASPVGTLMLTHALAHALPPPGYNRQRPYCMVLTLANGGVYFFQAGTEELVNEWVSTCNYWAARQSKEPLAGGVSNMEYGWNRVVDDRGSSEENVHPEVDRSDIMSVRSSRSRYGKTGAASVRSMHSPWADRLFINDWKQPLHPTMPSMHDEETQLEALQKHVTYLSTELEVHNEMRAPMATLYTPRSTNANKSLTNWENKSKYLLSEIVKYQSYIDSLQNAMALRLKRRGDKALERALVGADPDDDDDERWSGHHDDDTVQEHGEAGNTKESRGSELVTPTTTITQLHRREVAETQEEDEF